MTLGALAFGGCAYLSEKQGELIFRPAKGTWRGYSPSMEAAFQEVWIPVGNGQRIHAWWLPSDEPGAASVLYLHGARWNLTGSVTRIPRWKQLGYSVLAIDYRGFGKSSEMVPTEASAAEDAVAAFDALGRLAPGRPRLIVGHSLGGAIGAELAIRRPQAAGLVLEATFTSVPEMVERTAWSYLPVSFILTQKFDTLSKMASIRMPVLVTHGTEDAIVPFEMGERLFAAANEPKRFIRVEGASHHNLSGVALDEYRAALSALFPR